MEPAVRFLRASLLTQLLLLAFSETLGLARPDGFAYKDHRGRDQFMGRTTAHWRFQSKNPPNLSEEKRSSAVGLEGLENGTAPQDVPGHVRLAEQWWQRQSEAPAGQELPGTVPCCCGRLPFKPSASCKRACSGPYVPELRYVGPVHGGQLDEPPTGPSTINLSTALFEQIQEREIVLIGDSMTRQWYESLMCWLGESWRGWATVTPDGEPRPALKAYLNAYMGQLQRWLPGAAHYSCWLVGSGTLLAYNVNRMPLPQIKRLISHHSRTAATLVLDPGLVHFNDIDGAGEAVRRLESVLEDLLHECSASGAACVLKGATPQHFTTGNFLWNEEDARLHQEYTNATGELMEKLKREGMCRGFVGWEAESTAWRDRVVTHASKKWKVPMLEVYHKLAPRGDAHPWHDCTHFSFDAEVWEPLHLELLSHLARLPRPVGGSFGQAPPTCPDLYN